MKEFLLYCTSKYCVRRSIKVSLIIGTILALLNHFDAIINNTLTRINIIQIVLTYLVPYMVTTYGSASEAVRMTKEKNK